MNINKPSLLQFMFQTSQDYMFDRAFLCRLRELSGSTVSRLHLEELVRTHPAPQQDCCPVIIFHCEYSSKRGPRLWSYLRNMDRKLNSDNYPHLTYPQTYLLQAGYSGFVIQQGDLCEPHHKYVSMFEESFKQDYLSQKDEEQQDWDGLDQAGRRKKKITQSKLYF